MSARPAGLLLALERAALVEGYLRDGGSIRVSSASLFDAYIPLSGVRLEHGNILDERFRQTCPAVVSAAADRLLKGRRAILDRACSWVGQGERAPSAGALLSLFEADLDGFVDRNRGPCAEYVAAYTSLLDAASSTSTSMFFSVAPALVNLDVAYWFSEGRVRRARLLPLHPLLFVRALTRLELGVDAGDVPPRLIAWHAGEQILHPDGCAGFFTCDATINVTAQALVQGVHEGLAAMWPDAPAVADVEQVAVTLLDVDDAVAVINALVDAVADRLRALGREELGMRLDVRFARSPDLDKTATHIPSVQELSARARAAVLNHRGEGLAMTIDPASRVVEEIRRADILLGRLRCSLGRRTNPDGPPNGLHIAYMAGKGGGIAWRGVAGSDATGAYMRLGGALGLEVQHRAWQRPALTLDPGCARFAVVASRSWPESVPHGWTLWRHALVEGENVAVFGATDESGASRTSSRVNAEVQAALEDASLRFYVARTAAAPSAPERDVARALNLLAAEEGQRRAARTLVMSLDIPQGVRWLESGSRLDLGEESVALLIIEADDEATELRQIRAVVASSFAADHLDFEGVATSLRLVEKVKAAFDPGASPSARSQLLDLAWMEAARQRSALTFEPVLHTFELRLTNGSAVPVRAEWWLLPEGACASWQVTEAPVLDAGGKLTQIRVVAPVGTTISVPMPSEPAVSATEPPEARFDVPEAKASSGAQGRTSASVEESAPAKPGWPLEQLRQAVEDAVGARGADDAALACALIRRVVQYRQAPVRYHLLAEVSNLLAPALADPSTARGLVDDEIQALVDLGDLVQSRDQECSPLRIQAASACVLRVAGARGRLALFGRAEGTLPKHLVEFVRCSGRLRIIEANAQLDKVEDELRFYGIELVDSSTWAQVPKEAKASQLLQAVTASAEVKLEALPSYEVFDPATPPNFFRGRFIRNRLQSVLERDGWAVAKSKTEFASTRYSLFHLAEGKTTGRDIQDRSLFLRLAAACAARSSEGKRFLARRGAGTLRLYFPPPMWIARMLLLGERIEPGDALEAAALGEDVLTEVVSVLERTMFCEVVRS